MTFPPATWGIRLAAMNRPLLLAVLVAAVSTASAAETVDAGVETLLQIADARWLDREVARFGSAQGRDPKPLRQWLARVLYRSNDLDGIDLSRPAVLAWRAGPSPLLAIIPVKHRQKFLDLFGAAADDEAPLVRTGDRDGMVVLTQNTAQGLRDYRLLVVDDTAYLARTASECRQLAERADRLLPQAEREAPALRLSAAGSWMAAHRPDPSSVLAGIGLRTGWPAMPLWSRLWSATLGQAEQIDASLIPTRDDARLSLTVRPRTGSELATWISLQRNTGSRLAAMADPRDLALRLTANATWAGALGNWAKGVPGSEPWQKVFTGADKGGEWALTVAVPAPGSQINALYLEHPRPTEQLQAVDDAIGATLGGTRSGASIPGAAVAARALPGGASVVALGTTRHVVMLESHGLELSALAERGQELVPRLSQVGTPGTDGAIASLWCDLDRLARVAKGVDPDAPAAPAPITCTITVGQNATRLQIETTARPEAIARALALVPQASEP